MAASALAQDDAATRYQSELGWAKTTGLPHSTIHQLWRAQSHFADEKDDDSRIVLLDAQSLASRNQILMVTAAGEPTCLAVTVFSKSSGHLKVWSESQTPDGDGFCAKLPLGILPEATVADGKIVITVPGDLISERASHAEVSKYIYSWTGTTYMFGHKEVFLVFVPESNRPKPRDATR